MGSFFRIIHLLIVQNQQLSLQINYIRSMKSLLLLLSLVCFGTTMAQDQLHFLLTSTTSIRITDPVCKEMAEKSKEQLINQIDEISKNQKKEGIKVEKMGLSQQAYFELLQQFKSNPDQLFPTFPITTIIFKSYKESIWDELFFSAQKVTVKGLGPADIEVSIKNVQVSSSETALDIEVKNLKKPDSGIQTTHLSCPTGRMLIHDFDEDELLPWLAFWAQFHREVKTNEWLEEAIMKVEPSLISRALLGRQTDEKIEKLGINTSENRTKGMNEARRILKEVPYRIPFNEIVASFISKDEQHLSLLTYHAYPTELYYEEEYATSTLQMTKWNFRKKDGHWEIYTQDLYKDSLDHIRSFYMAGFDAENRFKEETWIEHADYENITEEFYHIELIRETASPEIENLIRTQIQPKLAALFSEKGSEYNNFYQRISPQYSSQWSEDVTEKVYFQDVLISNPEKTAYIFPVILTTNQNDEYESTDEVFKFYVLLKNQDGSYTLYDWYFFKPFDYWGTFTLLRCAERHLKNISTYTSDQKVINDQAFWDNYLFKKGARGYDYLTEVVLPNESPSISKSEFDATVQDCIDLLLEHDVVDLYDHQLKQIIRCVNTIQKENLSGAQNAKLISLSQELHFQKRLNKIQKNEGNYYLGLNLEFGAPMKERSYYHIR